MHHEYLMQASDKTRTIASGSATVSQVPASFMSGASQKSISSSSSMNSVQCSLPSQCGVSRDAVPAVIPSSFRRGLSPQVQGKTSSQSFSISNKSNERVAMDSVFVGGGADLALYSGQAALPLGAPSSMSYQRTENSLGSWRSSRTGPFIGMNEKSSKKKHKTSWVSSTG